MKKLIAILLSLVLVLSCFSGCESESERKLRQAKETASELEEAYWAAKERSDRLQRDFDKYERAVEALEKAKK